MIEALKKSQWQACFTVSVIDFPDVCGPCDPSSNEDTSENLKEEQEVTDDDSSQCPPCTLEECDSDLNHCPVFERTYVCTNGASTGGCSGEPWVDHVQCKSCCELTQCQKLRDKEAEKITNDIREAELKDCPPCPPSVCYGELNLCPIHQAPFLCTEGKSVGGCSSRPWHLSEGGQCSGCCEITSNC